VAGYCECGNKPSVSVNCGEFLDWMVKVKVEVIPQQPEVAQCVPGRLRSRVFLTFGNTRMVGRQPYAPTAFTSGEIPDTHFQRLSRSQGAWFGSYGKNPQ
jgi:hypothetical protein